jgi:hypothetical protein
MAKQNSLQHYIQFKQLFNCFNIILLTAWNRKLHMTEVYTVIGTMDSNLMDIKNWKVTTNCKTFLIHVRSFPVSCRTSKSLNKCLCPFFHCWLQLDNRSTQPRCASGKYIATSLVTEKMQWLMISMHSAPTDFNSGTTKYSAQSSDSE